jgi:four helix bundle protein
MATIERFEDIEAWKVARALTQQIYQLSERGGFARDYGLRDQMRRAAVSVMSNIAEGFESRSQAMFADYLSRAKGSAGELRAQLYVALDASYLSQEEFSRLKSETEHCSRLISRFISYLDTQPNTRRTRESITEYEISSP